MAKNRKNMKKVKVDNIIRNYSRYRAGVIMKEFKEVSEPKKGIRQIVIETYYAKGKLEAYKVINEYNNIIGREAYTREIFEDWIAEEERKKGYEKYDGFDR